MKRISLFLVTLIFLAATSTAHAHPPSDIKITFDPNTKILQAIIFHNVKNPLNHYIKKVEVNLNNKDIIEHEISKQDNNENQTASYLIPDAKVDDVISVEGQCSINGKLKKEITIKSAR